MNKPGSRKAIGPATSYIAGELRAQRARLGWSFAELEERSGVPTSTADRALRGKSGIPVEILIQLCVGMGMDVGELLRDASELSE